MESLCSIESKVVREFQQRGAKSTTILKKKFERMYARNGAEK